eukprot:1156293-Pelagomonas_calceolata.AAC.2
MAAVIADNSTYGVGDTSIVVLDDIFAVGERAVVVCPNFFFNVGCDSCHQCTPRHVSMHGVENRVVVDTVQRPLGFCCGNPNCNSLRRAEDKGSSPEFAHGQTCMVHLQHFTTS